MVREVLAWRKEKPEEASLLWAALQKGNDDLASELTKATRLSQIPEMEYQSLRDTISTVRSLIQEMSSKSGVPIEPKVQTDLLDSCCKVPGVVGGVVPGAGGYDAIALLIIDKPGVLEGLQDLLENYTASVEEGGTEAKIGRVSLLEVRQELDGVRAEDSKGYEAWLS
ncbi:MAG: phosphomevalonate kinase [Pleopsidium flavum]|nr:MAG: phosphomevalonate kinase [Pleopsidium flavum]